MWIIDPIDGTANYARGIAHYCVSIGYVERGVPTVGALHDPSHERLYFAERGERRLAGRRRRAPRAARVSPVAASTRPPSNAAGRCAARRPTTWPWSSACWVPACAFRRAGSGALGLADVAAGRTEGYCELHINSWDCAAGLLLVTEAGGLTNDFFAGNGLLAGNPLLATNRRSAATPWPA